MVASGRDVQKSLQALVELLVEILHPLLFLKIGPLEVSGARLGYGVQDGIGGL